MRGTDLTRANISRTLAASTQMGLGTKPGHLGIALSNRGTTPKGKDEAAARSKKGNRVAGAMQHKTGSVSGI